MFIGSRFKPSTFRKVAGVLLFLAGFVLLMGIITAETKYPAGYSTFKNEVSDLGATKPPRSITTQPSATIFNVTMLLSGLMIAAAAFGVYLFSRKKIFSILLGLLGTGVFLVGVFPGNHALAHPLVALLSFASAGLAAVAAVQVTQSPFRYVSIALGAITLMCLFLSGALTSVVGKGGAERWIVYPAVLWIAGMGAYFLGGRYDDEDSTIAEHGVNAA